MKIVGILIDGEKQYHAAGVVSDYDTLCGIDADDASVGHGGLITVPVQTKINCANCKHIWQRTITLGLRHCDFESNLP